MPYSLAFSAPSQIDIVFRLLVSAVLGGVIGYERETSHRPAGLRTHVMVSVGSALFTLVSMHIGKIPPSDSTRIAAQIVSGIGFLGAGTIIRHRANILGLTTAASLWAVAGIGMAAGAAYYTGAIATTLLVFISLTVLRRIEIRFEQKKNEKILLLKGVPQEKKSQVAQMVAGTGMEIKESSAEIKDDRLEMRFVVTMPRGLKQEEFMCKLIEIGIAGYEWQDTD